MAHMENRNHTPHTLKLRRPNHFMDWTVVVIAALVVMGFLALKRLSFMSADLAQQHLRAGALIIDVRSPKEFQGGHVPNAINIPLGSLDALPRHVPDKGQVLLLHCLSGGRSAIARQQVKRLGYANAFNLGSYSRAERIIRESRNSTNQVTGKSTP
jgi:phage shock protein E